MFSFSSFCCRFVHCNMKMYHSTHSIEFRETQEVFKFKKISGKLREFLIFPKEIHESFKIFKISVNFLLELE